MVVEVFITQRDAQYPLRDELAHAVFNPVCVPVVDKLVTQARCYRMPVRFYGPRSSKPPPSKLIIPPSNFPITSRGSKAKA